MCLWHFKKHLASNSTGGWIMRYAILIEKRDPSYGVSVPTLPVPMWLPTFDRETARLILWITNRLKETFFNANGVTTKQFPCKYLRTIDQLWLDNSGGKFGFSVQKRIWHEVRNDMQKFGNQVGWRVNNKWLTSNQLTDDLRPPEGRFPSTSRVGS